MWVHDFLYYLLETKKHSAKNECWEKLFKYRKANLLLTLMGTNPLLNIGLLDETLKCRTGCSDVRSEDLTCSHLLWLLEMPVISRCPNLSKAT